MQCLPEYYFLNGGTLCDASKQIFFLSIVCSDCKNTVFFMLGHFVMHQNKFSFEVLYAIIARILFTVFWMLQHCVMHQDKFSFQVLYAVFARVRFPSYCDASKHILF